MVPSRPRLCPYRIRNPPGPTFILRGCPPELVGLEMQNCIYIIFFLAVMLNPPEVKEVKSY